MSEATAPDFLFIDTILLAYRLGRVSQDEQKTALIASARAAKDAISFLDALENFGVGRRSQLFSVVGKLLAAPSFYRIQYPSMIGLRTEGAPAEPFLNNPRVVFLVEPVLTSKQQSLFYSVYWDFVRHHEQTLFDAKNGNRIGLYATEAQDNDSTLPRFSDYLTRRVNQEQQRFGERYERFPTDIVVAILQRAFT